MAANRYPVTPEYLPLQVKKATRIVEIDAAINKFLPIPHDHPFYVDLSRHRGETVRAEVFDTLNVSGPLDDLTYDHRHNVFNKTRLFLAGMRGSGKTSELDSYAAYLHRPNCFFVVTCNVDIGLDTQNIEYMDIVIFQLKELTEKLAQENVPIEDDAIVDLNRWFEEKIREINIEVENEAGAKVELGGDTDFPFSVTGALKKLLGISLNLTYALKGTHKRQSTVRKVIRNNFPQYAARFNRFIEEVNLALRQSGKGREVLFIIDGIEKTMTAAQRRKIIIDESNRIQSISVNTIFTLPIELRKEEDYIKHSADVIAFPFVQIVDRQGNPQSGAWNKMREVILARIDQSLFEDTKTLDQIIQYSGGDVRQTFIIIEKARLYIPDGSQQLTASSIAKAAKLLGNRMARNIESTEWEELVRCHNMLEKGIPIEPNPAQWMLLEKNFLMEYNDMTHKRVNPLLEISDLYQYKVHGRI